MSCLPNTPCYSSVTVTYPSGCTSCSPGNVDSDYIIYSGPNLSCSGIATCDTVTTAIQKLDAKVCEAQAGVSAVNGVNKSGNFIKLGGDLTEPTVITTTVINTLSILNLQDDNLPQYLVSLSNGILRRTAYQNLLGILTADNGLSKNSATNVRLGGSLVVPTTITTDATNTLSITGLVTNPIPDFILTETTAGVVTKTTLASIIPPTPATITADNGLIKTGNNIQLGGLPLITPTTITADPTNTLSIAGLVTSGSVPTYILTETSGNVVQRVVTSTVLDAAAALITADNGLTKTLNNIQLGGTLLNDTAVQIGTYKLTLRSQTSPASGTGIEIDCSTTVPVPPALSTPRINFYGRSFFDATSYVGVRTFPDGFSGASTDIPFKVEKLATFINESLVTASDSVISTPATSGNGSLGRLYAGSTSRVYWTTNAPQAIDSTTVYSAHLSYFQFVSSPLTTITGANCSASAAQGYFLGPGTINRIIAYRAMNPIGDTISGFSGTIAEAVGLQIEDQKSDGVAGTQITDSYGIKQLGADDRNYFNGTFQFPSTNVSMGTETLISGTATVFTSAVKTGSRIFLTYNAIAGKLGFLSAPSASIIDGVSFVINSTDDTGFPVIDDSTVNWWVINN